MSDDDRSAVREEVRREFGDLPEPEVGVRAQAALQALRDRDENLAKEFADALKSAAGNPDALKMAVIGFAERHPDLTSLLFLRGDAGSGGATHDHGIV